MHIHILKSKNEVSNELTIYLVGYKTNYNKKILSNLKLNITFYTNLFLVKEKKIYLS